jgi:hypothetical protein
VLRDLVDKAGLMVRAGRRKLLVRKRDCCGSGSVGRGFEYRRDFESTLEANIGSNYFDREITLSRVWVGGFAVTARMSIR